MDQRVHQVIKLMKVDSEQELSLGKMAGMVNLTPARFCRLFTAETGVAPLRYLKLLKLQEAQRLLETTWLSVKVIAAQVGINDVSHFTRDFKKVYSFTPTQYRAQHLETEMERAERGVKIG